MHLRTLFPLFAGIAFFATAYAQPVESLPAPAPLDRYFVHIDKNDDDRIDRSEIANNKWLIKRFARIDSNRDSLLDKEELRRYRLAIRTHHQLKLDAHLKASGQYGTLAMSKAEAADAMMFRIVDNFEEIDRNHDGLVTRNELHAYAINARRNVPMT